MDPEEPNPVVSDEDAGKTGFRRLSETPIPQVSQTAAEVADSARLLDPDEEEPAIPDELAGRLGFRRLSQTPIPEVAETAAEVADTAAGLDIETASDTANLPTIVIAAPEPVRAPSFHERADSKFNVSAIEEHGSSDNSPEKDDAATRGSPLTPKENEELAALKEEKSNKQEVIEKKPLRKLEDIAARRAEMESAQTDQSEAHTSFDADKVDDSIAKDTLSAKDDSMIEDGGNDVADKADESERDGKTKIRDEKREKATVKRDSEEVHEEAEDAKFDEERETRERAAPGLATEIDQVRVFEREESNTAGDTKQTEEFATVIKEEISASGSVAAVEVPASSEDEKARPEEVTRALQPAGRGAQLAKEENGDKPTEFTNPEKPVTWQLPEKVDSQKEPVAGSALTEPDIAIDQSLVELTPFVTDKAREVDSQVDQARADAAQSVPQAEVELPELEETGEQHGFPAVNKTLPKETASQKIENRDLQSAREPPASTHVSSTAPQDLSELESLAQVVGAEPPSEEGEGEVCQSNASSTENFEEIPLETAKASYEDSQDRMDMTEETTFETMLAPERRSITDEDKIDIVSTPTQEEAPGDSQTEPASGAEPCSKGDRDEPRDANKQHALTEHEPDIQPKTVPDSIRLEYEPITPEAPVTGGGIDETIRDVESGAFPMRSPPAMESATEDPRSTEGMSKVRISVEEAEVSEPEAGVVLKDDSVWEISENAKEASALVWDESVPRATEQKPSTDVKATEKPCTSEQKLELETELQKIDQPLKEAEETHRGPDVTHEAERASKEVEASNQVEDAIFKASRMEHDCEIEKESKKERILHAEAGPKNASCRSASGDVKACETEGDVSKVAASDETAPLSKEKAHQEPTIIKLPDAEPEACKTPGKFEVGETAKSEPLPPIVADFHVAEDAGTSQEACTDLQEAPEEKKLAAMPEDSTTSEQVIASGVEGKPSASGSHLQPSTPVAISGALTKDDITLGVVSKEENKDLNPSEANPALGEETNKSDRVLMRHRESNPANQSEQTNTSEVAEDARMTREPHVAAAGSATGFEVTQVSEIKQRKGKKPETAEGYGPDQPADGNHDRALAPPTVHRKGNFLHDFFRALFVDWIGGFLARCFGRRK